MFGSRVTITGDTELIAALQSLPEKVERRVLRAGLQHAAKPIVVEAKRRATRESPTIANAMTLQAKRFRGTIVLYIGPSAGDRGAWRLKRQVNPLTGEVSVRFHKPEFTAHLVELGTEAHKVRIPGLKMTIRHPGAKATPYLVPALTAEEDDAIGRFRRYVLSRVEQYAQRAAKGKG